jgi:hypothetical protein
MVFISNTGNSMRFLAKSKFRLLLIIPLMLLALQTGIVVLHHHMDGSWYDQADPSHQLSAPASTQNSSSQKLFSASAPFITVSTIASIPPQSVYVSHSRFISPAVRSDVAVGHSTRNRAPPA